MIKTALKFELNAAEDQGKITRFSISFEPMYLLESSNFLTIEHKEYQPKIGDKIFLLPGVNIPRVKLKDLTLNYNIQTVRDSGSANVFFGGDKSKFKFYDESWGYSISTEAFKTCMEALKPVIDEYYQEKINTALEYYTHDRIYGSWSDIGFIADSNLVYYTNQSLAPVYIKNPGAVAQESRTNGYILELNPKYKDLLENLNGKAIIHERTLIDKLNNSDDAVTIDKEVFEKLSDMLRSSDTDNHVLAMEIMANSNYKESLLYLEILFKEYDGPMQNSSTKNHVNFKSLLSYLGKSRYNFESTIDSIVNSLIAKDCLTEEAIQVLCTRYSGEINNGGSRMHFKVKTITMSDEVLTKLNCNFEYQIRPDFVPLELEISHEEEEKQESISEEDLTWL
jgi:hypothetical protein